MEGKWIKYSVTNNFVVIHKNNRVKSIKSVKISK
jgi:hypothetical protein